MMLFFVALTAVATALITWFNWQLVNVTHQMREVTERSLRSDRPYLVVESVELHDFYPVSQEPVNPVRATFMLRNWGKGTAVEVTIKMRFAVVELDIPAAKGE